MRIRYENCWKNIACDRNDVEDGNHWIVDGVNFNFLNFFRSVWISCDYRPDQRDRTDVEVLQLMNICGLFQEARSVGLVQGHGSQSHTNCPHSSAHVHRLREDRPFRIQSHVGPDQGLNQEPKFWLREHARKMTF